MKFLCRVLINPHRACMGNGIEKQFISCYVLMNRLEQEKKY
ncbi:Segregation and condensation protein ScpA [Bacillus cereus Rock4-18]|nr:Segregation and condensation protein ScpA [Bacillus cereus Rock4-18]